jgi:hypothetical protein
MSRAWELYRLGINPFNLDASFNGEELPEQELHLHGLCPTSKYLKIPN